MDYGALPPEVNSGRMYAGPGTESMVAAAAAWDGLAAELQSAATAYTSAIQALTSGPWQGPSSAAMATAAAPYAAWMSSTAAQAEQTATQARSAAAAFETAFASMVPPPVIAANRSQLASLVATNIFGQNTVAIAATEAQYGEMWAQDAAAMYGYAGQSAGASQVTPFTAAPQVANPDGALGQLAAAGQAAATSAGANAQSQLSGFVSAAPSALQSLATPTAQAVDLPSFTQISAYLEAIPKLILPANDVMITAIYGLVQGVRSVQGAAAAAVSGAGSLAAGLGSATHVAGVTGLGAAGAAVSASAGEAGMVGALSVPTSWAAATPTIRLAASVLQGTSLGATPTVVAQGSGGLFSQMALAGMAGSALGGAAPRVVAGGVGRVGRPLDGKIGEKEGKKSDKLERVLAEMSQKPESVQHWHTDEAQLESLLAQLSKKPGVHAVHVGKGKSGFRQPPPI